jgi:hypothetical protein
MSDSFETEMLDFCVRFLTQRGDKLSAEQLSTLSVLFPKQIPSEMNPLDPTSTTLQWTLTVDQPSSKYIDPLHLAWGGEPYVEEHLCFEELPTTILERLPAEVPPQPKPKPRRCPYGYNGKWASPIPVTVVRQLLKLQWRVTLKDVIKEYAKHGETRLTHEMAINYLAHKKKMTPEEFLKTVDVPQHGYRDYWGRWSNRGPYWLYGW